MRSLRWGLPSHCEYGSHIVSVVNRVQHLSPPLSLSHTPTHTHTMNQVKEFFIICTHYITLFHYLCLSLSLSLSLTDSISLVPTFILSLHLLCIWSDTFAASVSSPAEPLSYFHANMPIICHKRPHKFVPTVVVVACKLFYSTNLASFHQNLASS